MQPWFWGHVFDSCATRENSSKHTNLHFLSPSAPGGKRPQEELLSPVASPRLRGAQGPGRGDGPGGDAGVKRVASRERATQEDTTTNKR